MRARPASCFDLSTEPGGRIALLTDEFNGLDDSHRLSFLERAEAERLPGDLDVGVLVAVQQL